MPTPDTLTTDKKVAVVIAEGLEEVEALAVVDLLYRAGIAVDMLAVGDRLEVTSSHRITFRCDALLAQRDLADYELVMLPGGIPGTPNLKATPAVTREVSRRLEEGLPLADESMVWHSSQYSELTVVCIAASLVVLLPRSYAAISDAKP